MNSSRPTVIVGAGFVGLFTALHLRHQQDLRSIILIDPQERFVFKPMLYELLTGELSEDVVCPTYKELLQGSDINFVQDKVVAINLQEKRLKLASGSDYIYGHLVLAVGSIQGYLGTEGAQKNAFAFRTQENAIALERQLRECLQRASQTDDEAQLRSLLTFAVVGAGPAGVEMAATLADLLPQLVRSTRRRYSSDSHCLNQSWQDDSRRRCQRGFAVRGSPCFQNSNSTC